MTLLAPDRLAAAERLGLELAHAWGSWGPTMTPDAARTAFISDRGGSPEVWVQDVASEGEPPAAHCIRFTEDPVLSVSWSADSAWLACLVATDGGVRTQVWVVRPDGSDARRIAGSRDAHAELGPWTRSGHHVVVTVPSAEPEQPTRSFLVDPVSGERRPLVDGDLISVLDLSVEERLVVVRDGQRGHQYCVVVDRLTNENHALLPDSGTGSTDVALLRPSALNDNESPIVAYLATDVDLPRRQLVAMPLGPDGWRGRIRRLAARDDAELEGLDADDAGRLLLLVWNVAGSSEIELFDTTTGERVPVKGLPGLVATTPVLSRDGGSVVLGVEGPERPRELWRMDTATHEWSRLTHVPALPTGPLVVPTLERFAGRDGLALSGWLYRAPGVPEGGPAMLSLHGGPESQERPTFAAQHQAVAASGITVFAPNARGSSGFGRDFVHADDVEKRTGAFDDVLAAADFLVDAGIADRARIAVTGRSYGGYLTLASLAFSPGVFAAGVDICGMSDLLTFYRDTEPWIASAAVTKYGHPEHDAELLERLSPLGSASAIDVPLLVVHGELDTNVPIGEAEQIVAALEGLGRPVEYLRLEGEGHEYRRSESKELLLLRLLRFLGQALSAGDDSAGVDPRAV
ncbi:MULTISPECIES: S9 family peptidase [unclassified Rathayibacter]|uniref:S9 family peptidase n=1 Tax=unclassified Rathayibacter TaxID=2609250 RepID=UPI00070058FA|nr:MULTISPECIES: prolyl oligopeptidase family serine peptidase [unclassified Rathayibacter]KQQ05434.1 peptidase S9 [Rathayibacter sp. Leaf294]KQS13297.1 peptidase S9 [Rathayibacter sp. Leaf185]